MGTSLSAAWAVIINEREMKKDIKALIGKFCFFVMITSFLLNFKA
jgi:hypothetical protein